MDAEKKVKLDELPNEGSSLNPLRPTPQHKQIVHKEVEPRVEKLKKLDDKTKIEKMGATWDFDRPEMLFGWAIYSLICLAAEYSGFYAAFIKEKATYAGQWMGLEEVFSNLLTMYLDKFIEHPIVFILLTPFIFKFRKTSPYQFTLGFDGISTVNRLGSDSHRRFIKWNEIDTVGLGIEEKRDVIYLNSLEGRMGLLIWDITDDKKKAIHLLVKGLLAPKHAFRLYLEKELL